MTFLSKLGMGLRKVGSAAGYGLASIGAFDAGMRPLEREVEDLIGRGREEFEIEIQIGNFMLSGEHSDSIPTQVEESLVRKYPITCIKLDHRGGAERARLTFRVDDPGSE